ncbi:ThiF family adenylyltransferase [Psychrobacillus sp. INOP01]|uniref:ThiF family adenylyltransferase n=1 Tax=Psychrobacillus sp. INOP01 TaxID=2829187 RepID=UPI001BA5C2BF|nr:ThiF family adenylyltransferase [Psychrobacillus sp. INOP01]QUG41508.1 ThiF family adenylyltransferase [Psychrobacillus sp. INOP01]
MDSRYSRQLLFKKIGATGQKHLGKAAVAIIGCGALGSAIAETLVRAGVGTIHIADRDYVELSNIQRQQLFTEEDAGEMLPKVVAAEKRLKSINSSVVLHTYLQNVDHLLIEYLVTRVDVIIDATDNFETRLLINDAAYKHNIPWIYGACVGSSGVVFPFIPEQTACFRCLLPVLPTVNETCDTVGIISPAVQITAATQCAEVLKLLTGNHEAVRTKVHHFDCWNNTFLDIGISKVKNETCETCSENATFPSLERDHQSQYAVLCGRDAVQVLPSPDRKVTLKDAEKLAKNLNAFKRRTPYFVEFEREHYRMLLFEDGRLLIHGIKDVNLGRRLYTEIFG